MRILRLLPILLFGLLAFFFGHGLSLDPQSLPTPKIGQMLPRFDLPSLLADQSQRFTPELLQGRMAILVVWASWCETCRDEQAFLMTLAQQQEIALYGLNYKDDPLQAKQWLAAWGNPYQAIGVDRKGTLALDLGVYGTPETYLIDQQGQIQYRYAGELTADVWKKDFVPLLTFSGRSGLGPT